MSYTIEYDHQFIRSTMGITPCWLAGDNNVTTGHGRNERRFRQWSIFMNMPGTTKEELLEKIKPSLGGYGEHWKRNGKWVDDKALIRWIENGCKTAATIEEIIDVNHFSAVYCFIVDTDNPGHFIQEEHIDNTVDYDDWLYRAMQEVNKAPRGKLFIVVRFSYDEPIRHPRLSKKQPNERVIIKRGTKYLVSMDAVKNCSRWSCKKEDAAVFSFTEASELRSANFSHLRDARIVSAKVKENSCNFVVKITYNTGGVSFVSKVTRGRFYYIPSIETAKHYSTKSSAKKAMERVKEILEYNKKTADVEIIAVDTSQA